MADRPNPYVHKDPGDIIRSGDWNELQVRAREDMRGHRHTGGDDGTLIPRTGIEEKAIDGSRIDPAAEVDLKKLTVNGDLKVTGKFTLDDVDDLLPRFKSLESDKLNRAGDTIAGSLSIKQTLTVSSSVGVGIDKPDAKLQIIHTPQDANGNALIVGSITGCNLRLGYHTDYSWVQSHGSKPLAINPIGNNVGIGTANPQAKLHVVGDLLGAAKDAALGTPLRIVVGRTEPGKNWQQYTTDGIFLDVDTSGAGFSSTPSYITSLGGNSAHWTTRGGTSIYSPTQKGFRVYINDTGITVQHAADNKWYINWIAIGN